MKKSKGYNLLDNWNEAGSDYKKFKRLNNFLSSNTKSELVDGQEASFYSLCDIDEYQTPGKATFYVLDKGAIDDFLTNGRRLCIGTIAIDELGEELYEELKNTTGLLMKVNGVKYIVSDIAIKTLALVTTVTGYATMNRHNLIRNMHFADALYAKNATVGNFFQIIYRERVINGHTVRKIFAAMTKNYTSVPQNIVSTLVDKISEDGILGQTVVDKWWVNQEFTDIIISFPDTSEDFVEAYKMPKKIVPGLFVCTSDTGSSSVICRGILKLGSSYVITEEVAYRHVGKVTSEDIIKDVDEHIFSNVRKLPEALASLIGTDILDYSSINLNSENGARKNKKAVSELNKAIIRKTLKNVLPIVGQDKLLEAMEEEINPQTKYTLYDIAVNIMFLTDRIVGYDDVTKDAVRKKFATVPYSVCGIVKELNKKSKGVDVYLIP